jgi:hypothetical protein
LDIIGAQDDFQANAQCLASPVDQPTRVLAVCPDLLQAGEIAFTIAQNLLASVAIILIGSRDKDVHHAPVGIDEEVTFAPFDLFMGIITDVFLPTAPPFSVVLTDWLSITAAEGVGSRPTRFRSASRSAVWIFSHNPLRLHRLK